MPRTEDHPVDASRNRTAGSERAAAQARPAGIRNLCHPELGFFEDRAHLLRRNGAGFDGASRSNRTKIEQFLRRVPYGVADSGLVYAAALSSVGEENYKLQSYYKWQPR